MREGGREGGVKKKRPGGGRLRIREKKGKEGSERCELTECR